MYEPLMHTKPELFDLSIGINLDIAKIAFTKHSKVLGIPLSELQLKGRIIDIGCGTGVIPNFILKYLHRDATLDAVDISEGILQYARKNYPNEQIKYSQLDALADVPDNKRGIYDVVTSCMVLHWVQDHK